MTKEWFRYSNQELAAEFTGRGLAIPRWVSSWFEEGTTRANQDFDVVTGALAVIRDYDNAQDSAVGEVHEEILAGLVGERAHSRFLDSTGRRIEWTYNADGTMAEVRLLGVLTAADFSYTTAADGFTSVIPNTAQAEACYNQVFAGGAYRLMGHEFEAFRVQARKAGYSVRKAEVGKGLRGLSGEGLLALLTNFPEVV